MDPRAAADFATGGGDPEPSPVDGHVEMEGIGVGDPEPGPETQSVYQSLWNTDPDIPLSQVESPWNPQQGGIRRMYRGLMKLGDVSGMPAIADILIGLAEIASDRGAFDQATSAGDSDPDNSDTDDGGTITDNDGNEISVSGIPTVGEHA